MRNFTRSGARGRGARADVMFWIGVALALAVAGAPASARLQPTGRHSTKADSLAAAGRGSTAAHPAASDTLAHIVAAETSGHPDFSGVWKLSMTRSVFGRIPGGQPTARTDSIRHAEPDVRQVLYLLNGARRDTTVYHYRTDGTPTVSAVDGRDIHSTAEWEGRTLHLHSTTRLLLLDMSLDERWELSAERRTLTMRRHVKYVLGEGDQTLVFERQ